MKKKIIKIAVSLLVLSFCMPVAAFAAGDAAEVAGGLAGLANSIRRIGIIMAAVAFVFTGIQLLVGGSQEAQKLWPRMLLIIAALAAILVLPSIIQMGANMSARWNPPSPPSGVTWNGGWGTFETEGVDTAGGSGGSTGG